MWMQDGCQVVYMDPFLHGTEWIMFHGHLETSFQNHLLEVARLATTTPGTPCHSRMLTTVGLLQSTVCEDASK